MFEGIKNMLGGSNPEKPEGKSTEVAPETEQAPTEEEAIDKKEIPLSRETKENISAEHEINPDGTVKVASDGNSPFRNDQEEAA